MKNIFVIRKRFNKLVETNLKVILERLLYCSYIFLYNILNSMDCLILKIITLITAKYVVSCHNDLTEASIVFSVSSYGRLPDELLLALSKCIIGNCLYACMQHFACLTINYHALSGICEQLADILHKEELTPHNEWVSYGHFESELVTYVYSYVLSVDEYCLDNSGT